MFTEEQVIAPHAVCQGCLLADRDGHPRWRGGELRCGRQLRATAPELYECQMGFRVAHVNSPEDA